MLEAWFPDQGILVVLSIVYFKCTTFYVNYLKKLTLNQNIGYEGPLCRRVEVSQLFLYNLKALCLELMLNPIKFSCIFKKLIERFWHSVTIDLKECFIISIKHS